MFGGLNRIFVAAVIAGAVLVVPPAALADGCNGGVSAVNVYKECLQTGGGGKPTGHHDGHRGGGSTSGPQTSPSAGGSGGSTAVVPIPKQTVKKLKKAGTDGRSLSHLVKGYGAVRLLQSSSAGQSAAEPTAVGSAFDLGSGPTALLIVLGLTAVLLLAASGFRGLQQRHR